MCEDHYWFIVLLDVEIYTKNEKYLTYIPVNYNGVQILLPDKKVLAKSTDGTMDYCPAGTRRRS